MTAPITVPLREPSACERCGGRRAVAKMSGPIPCPACVPRVRVPCAYCTEGVALGTGETCRECDGQGSRG
jgi:DnaJ-class molecular chaperone